MNEVDDMYLNGEENNEDEDRPSCSLPGWSTCSTKGQVRMVDFLAKQVRIDHKDSTVHVVNFKVHNEEVLAAHLIVGQDFFILLMCVI